MLGLAGFRTREGLVGAGTAAAAAAWTAGLVSLRKGRDSSPEGPIFRGPIFRGPIV
jgi:hypothetical protein